MSLAMYKNESRLKPEVYGYTVESEDDFKPRSSLVSVTLSQSEPAVVLPEERTASDTPGEDERYWGIFPKTDRMLIMEQRSMSMDRATMRAFLLSQVIFAVCMAITVWRISIIETDEIDVKPINLTKTACETFFGKWFAREPCSRYLENA
eukprot:CAMPEP_0116011222 /NCGR_PEP_ID=MMETSP0321-20121206/4444_1 /TAXON_ID=163516 /ORGANISM="Leptocylindrus danicus var. danicus, Strain B650" /LENGTH=149 /DNA_ID=CAMNT_0003480423 /DNA_START=149 /DNA_END=598 /DNA_ORIENTATION=-